MDLLDSVYNFWSAKLLESEIREIPSELSRVEFLHGAIVKPHHARKRRTKAMALEDLSDHHLTDCHHSGHRSALTSQAYTSVDSL